MNKFEHLETYVHDLNPDIIAITESWMSSQIFDSELTIDGHDLFRQDRPVDHDGGGVLLYVRSSLHAVQFNLSAKFPEQVWCYVLDSTGHRCYIGVCYRSPTINIYGHGNHVLLQDIVNELGDTHKHFVLMGDCNYRYQSWPPELDQPGITAEAVQFSHCIEDNFFTQHVDFSTRNDAILDLVITDEPNMVHNMTDLGPFPGSDHNALCWQLEFNTKEEVLHKQSLDYSKMDITALKCELSKIDWNVLLDQLTAEESWIVFKDKLEYVEEKYIPLKRSHTRRRKPPWMTHKTVKVVANQRKVYGKYKDVTHPAYRQAQRKAKAQIRKDKKEFEKKLAIKTKEDRKSFFAYGRSKSKTKVKVGSLEDSYGNMQNETTTKAELLNNFFISFH